MTRHVINGQREKMIIAKENNFAQPGARYRTWDPARQERFVQRMADMLLDPRCTKEVRRVWLGYWSQCDVQLGQKLAARLQSQAAL